MAQGSQMVDVRTGRTFAAPPAVDGAPVELQVGNHLEVLAAPPGVRVQKGVRMNPLVAVHLDGKLVAPPVVD